MTISHPIVSDRMTWFEKESDTDVVVIGAGIAGLSFALRLSDEYHITLVTKDALGESNTKYAQGGMAAAVGPDDTPELHLHDTIDAGDGLTDPESTFGLVERGASAVRWLLRQGARFDLQGNTLQLGQEAAHSRRRILHAGGDATGAEIERALVSRIRKRRNTRILENTLAIDLVKAGDDQIAGVALMRRDGAIERVVADTTVLANGGAGQLWRVTSNPAGATGDGIAMALRAGIELADLEFDQFHPTVLNMPGVAPFLITEAVRGEGAWLVNSAGERFMPAVDHRAELAPRNVVASEIQRQLTEKPGNFVYLDLRHLDADLVRQRFPTVIEMLAAVGLDLTRDLIPVAPAAHYFMGGVLADVEGRTSAEGLLAIGEVSCTGVHGANRLASNSLLEGLVFGINAADRLHEDGLPGDLVPENQGPRPESVTLDIEHIRTVIRDVMNVDVGVLRDCAGLERARERLVQLPVIGPGADRAGLIVRNMREVAIQITESALAREESRGGHQRSDFPETDDALDDIHQFVRVNARGERESRFGPLQPELVQARSGTAFSSSDESRS